MAHLSHRLLAFFAVFASWRTKVCAGPRSLKGTYDLPSTLPSYSASQPVSIHGTASSPLYDQGNRTTSGVAPSSLNPDQSRQKYDKTCLVGECSGYVAATKTADEALAGLGGPLGNLPDSEVQAGCVLWNDTCTGDKSAARDHFFGTLKGRLYANRCFTKPHEDCTKIVSPARMSEFQAIQDWMRSPQCENENAGYNSMMGFPPPIDYNANCCGICGVTAGVVDVYYWPESDASVACLDVVGDHVNPLTYGATIDSSNGLNYWEDDNSVLQSSVETYWGCMIETDGQSSYISTAQVSQINSITFKRMLVNPWSVPSCIGSPSPPQMSSEALTLRPSIRARVVSLAIQNTTTQLGGLPASTLVVSGHTFTSPSIYANFQSISGADECGGQTIVSTMLSFAPGKLSTIEGGLNPGDGNGSSQVTKPFDFRDMPCPPQSVMEANWYKPEPGVPYRPLIAMPDQIQNLNPFFSRCTHAFFTGFDPPKTLEPARAMVPTTTAADPKAAITETPMPSATQDPGARKTASPAETGAAAAAVPSFGDPNKPDAASILPPSQAPNSAASSLPQDPSVSGDLPAQPGTDPDDTGTDNHVNANPGQGIDPDVISDGTGGVNQQNDPNIVSISNQPSNAPEVWDPSNVSPIQISQLEDALASTNTQGGDSDSDQQNIPIGAVQFAQSSPQPQQSQPGPKIGSPSLDPGFQKIDEQNSNLINAPAAQNQATVINGESVQRVSDGISIAGTIITPGARPVIISGTPIAVGPSDLLVGESTIPLATAFPEQPNPIQAASPQATNILGQIAQQVANGISIAGATLVPGAPPITISDSAVYVDSSALVVGSNTMPLTAVFPTQPTPNVPQYQPTTINGQKAQLLSDGGVSIAGTTINPGAPVITIAGTPIFINLSNIAIGTDTIPITAAFTIQPSPDTTPSQPTTILGQAAQLFSAGISIAGTTLTPGSPPLTISNTPISINPSGLIIGTAAPTPLPNPTITTLANQLLTLLPTAAIIGSATLTPGGPTLTLSGTPLYIASSNLIFGTSTIPLPSTPLPLSNAGMLITTIADQSLTAVPTAVAVAGTTLTPGASGISVSGTLVSLITASGLVIGSQTIVLQNASTSTGMGLGGLIMEPFATADPTTTATGTETGNPNANTSGTVSATGENTSESAANSLLHPSLLKGIGMLLATACVLLLYIL